MTPFAFIPFMLCLKSDALCIEQSISVQTSHIPSADSLWPVEMALVSRELELGVVQRCPHASLGSQALTTKELRDSQQHKLHLIAFHILKPIIKISFGTEDSISQSV